MGSKNVEMDIYTHNYNFGFNFSLSETESQLKNLNIYELFNDSVRLSINVFQLLSVIEICLFLTKLTITFSHKVL